MKFEVEIPLTELEHIDALWRFVHADDQPPAGLRTFAQLVGSWHADPVGFARRDRGDAYMALFDIVDCHARYAFEAAMDARECRRAHRQVATEIKITDAMIDAGERALFEAGLSMREGDSALEAAVKATHYNPKKPPAPKLRLRMKPWRPAAEIIDWSLPCPSIFERKRPLKENTLKRIARGVMRYVVLSPHPFVVPVTHGGDRRVHPADEPLRTITTANGGEFALVAPVLAGCGGRAAQSPEYRPERPINTLTTKADQMLVAPGERKGQAPRSASVEAPLATVVTMGNQAGLVAAFLAQFNNDRGGPNPGNAADAPLSTIATAGPHQALVSAHLAVNRNSQKPWAGLDEPAQTVTAGGAHLNLVDSHLLNLKGSDRRDSPADAPAPTICAGGSHVAEVRAFLLKYYGNEKDGAEIGDPLATVTTKDRFGLVTVTIGDVPYVIADIGMRMLTPRELFNAQGFKPDYRIDLECAGRRLSKADQIEKVGNSVSPPPATALAVANAPLFSRLAPRQEAAA